MKKRTIVIPVVILIVVGVVGWRLLASQTDAVPTVPVATVATTHLTKEVIATGSISSAIQTSVTAQASGRIEYLAVDEGDLVQSGTVIATLEDDAIRLRERSAAYGIESAQRSVREQLMTLRSQYDDTQDTLRRARRAFQRAEELHAIGSASDETLRTAREDLQAAERAFSTIRERLNHREGRPLDDPRDEPFRTDEEIIADSIEVKQARASLDGIREELEGYTIRSRIRGTITSLSVDEGQPVSAGTQIAMVHDRETLEVVSPIDEVDLGYVEVGQPVRIESDSFIGRSLEGTVDRIAPIIQHTGDARVCDVTIGFEDPERIARVGASCTIYVTVRDMPEAPSIPIQAYFLDSGKKFVYVPVPAAADTGADPADQDAAPVYVLEKREVTIGIIGLDTVEVVSGLELGETVVAADVREFHEGQRVAVAPTETGDDPTQ